MRKTHVVGIDVGTYHVKVVVAEVQKNGAPPRIIGTGTAQTHGLRHGYIIHGHDVTNSISAALKDASDEAGITIDRAYVSVGGVGLEDLHARGEAVVSLANSEVSETDLENAMTSAEHRIANELVNRKIVHAIPIRYTLDGHEVIGRPAGLRGSKIEVEALFITVLEQHLDDLVAAIDAAGVETIDVLASPIAASLVTLSKQQKMVGCVLTNIGAETVSIVVFEENTPVSLKVFPIGSTDITNDIALELRVPLSEAEQIKRGAITGSTYPKKKLDDIVTARLKDIFTLIQSHLKSIDKAGLLPAGVVLTGGGSSIAMLEEYARAALKLPSEMATTRLGQQRLKDSSWAVAYGLCLWGVSYDADTVGIDNARAAGARVMSWFKQFLP
ncbi:MAG: cell division protein FtsA [bacterium]|nr:cell division protein FtsA [bacterium]